MLKLSNVRRVVATSVFVVGTLYLLQLPFLKFEFFGIFPQMQLVPAVLAGSFALMLGVLVLSLLFGRLYCSTICPLGVLQDVLIHVKAWQTNKHAALRKKRRSRKYEKPQNILRYTVLAVSAVSLLMGSTFVLILLDPYSIYTRMSIHLFHPIGVGLNNVLAWGFNAFDSFVFASEHYLVPPTLVLLFTVFLTLVVVGFALTKERFWCNAICPVGTLLGLMARFSVFRVAVDTSKCGQCGKCAVDCKSHTINQKQSFSIDYSRCVSCYNCIDSCDKQHALKLVSVFRANKLKAKNPLETEKRNPRKTAKNE